eukprot:Opistho-2@6509
MGTEGFKWKPLSVHLKLAIVFIVTCVALYSAAMGMHSMFVFYTVPGYITPNPNGLTVNLTYFDGEYGLWETCWRNITQEEAYCRGSTTWPITSTMKGKWNAARSMSVLALVSVILAGVLPFLGPNMNIGFKTSYRTVMVLATLGGIFGIISMGIQIQLSDDAWDDYVKSEAAPLTEAQAWYAFALATRGMGTSFNLTVSALSISFFTAILIALAPELRRNAQPSAAVANKNSGGSGGAAELVAVRTN